MSNRTDIVVETDNAEGQVLLSASRVYDLTEDKTQNTINSEVGSSLTSLGNTLSQLDGRVDSTQSTEAYVLGAVTAGVTISGTGKYVIYNNALYTTTSSIASTDTAPYTGKITPVPAGGGLNSLKNSIDAHIQEVVIDANSSYSFTVPNYKVALIFSGQAYGDGGMYIVPGGFTTSHIVTILADANLTVTKSGANTCKVEATGQRWITIVM